VVRALHLRLNGCGFVIELKGAVGQIVQGDRQYSYILVLLLSTISVSE